MPLTSNQKHYIKKNIDKLPINKLMKNLGLSEREIRKYLKKQWGTEKYEKFFNKNIPQEIAEDSDNLNLKSFFIDNANYLIPLFILVLFSYFNSMNNAFVSDDLSGIKHNPDIDNLKVVFSSFIGSLQRFVYFIAYNLGGINPIYFRAFNILFHLGSTFSIFAILKFSGKKNLAFLAAALFAVHPIFIESVTWISGMPYSMYSFFFLLSFVFYILKEYHPKFFYLSIVFFTLSVMSSEKATPLFLIFFLYEVCFGNLRINWKKIAPFAAASFVLVGILALRVEKRISDINATSYQNTEGLYNPLEQIPTAIANYLKLIFWPQKLSLYQTEMNFSSIQYTFFLIIFVGFLGLIFYGWKKNKSLFFWLSFFVIALSPTLTPFKISWIVAERYAYLGSIGIIVSIAMLFDWMIEKASQKSDSHKMAAYSVFAIIIIFLSIRTIARNIDWKNEDNLWIATAKVSPSGPNIHNNLGDVYGRQGDLEKSAEEFKKAIEINPNYGDAYHNLGNAYNAMGKKDLAIENYEKALETNPNLWQSYQNLASIYFENGNKEKALEYIKKALVVNPDNPQLNQNLKVIQSQK